MDHILNMEDKEKILRLKQLRVSIGLSKREEQELTNYFKFKFSPGDRLEAKEIRGSLYEQIRDVIDKDKLKEDGLYEKYCKKTSFVIFRIS